MKFNNILILGSAILMFACNQNGNTAKTGNGTVQRFGDSFDMSKAVNVEAALEKYNKMNLAEAIISGKISAVCQGEGCWYSIESGHTNQYVDFGEKFTIPKDAAGKETVAIGRFYKDTISIEDLKSEAKESGKSQTEVDAIKEPKVNISFQAAGLVIK
jgi:hypothetical protein